MPAPKKPPPHVELDAAAIDDGWFLPPEVEFPKPPRPDPVRTELRSDSNASKPISRPRQRLEDWFDEIDLGWVLPDDDEPLGPPTPAEVVSGHEDVDTVYEALEVTTDVEVEAIEPEPEAIEPDEIDAPVDERLDLNQATLEQLVALPGIGPKKAHAILAWRDEHQRFGKLDDLAQVTGFGARTVAKLAEHLVVRAPRAN